MSDCRALLHSAWQDQAGRLYVCACVLACECVCVARQAGRLSVNVGERALLSEWGNAESSRAGINYNLHSPSIFPKGVGWRGGSMWEEEGRAVWEKDTKVCWLTFRVKAVVSIGLSSTDLFSITFVALKGGCKDKSSWIHVGKNGLLCSCSDPYLSIELKNVIWKLCIEPYFGENYNTSHVCL